MKSRFLMSLVILPFMAGCQWVSTKNNPNRVRDSERTNYQQCLQKNGNDKSKCANERQQYLDRQEMELMDNNG